MLKNIIFILILCINLFFMSVNAGEIEEVETFFDNYVKAANTYSKKVADYYLPDAKITRVVLKKDKTTQAVSFTMDRYKKELTKGQPLARLSGYKNKYINRKFEKLENGDYKISATRIPNNDKNGLAFYFIVTNTANGWKVKEESMETTVQKFLTSK